MQRPNRGFFATRARLARSLNNNSTSSRAGEDLSSLFDRLVSVAFLQLSFFFPLLFYPFLRLLSFEMKELFFRRGAKKNWCWVFRWMSFYVWGVCCPESNCSSSVEYFSSFRKRRNDFLARRSFRVDEFFFLNS